MFEVEAGSDTITTLASFDGSDGIDPSSGLVEDGRGNLFGTTGGGGVFADGTVFEVVADSGTITTLASFNGANGSRPNTGLIEDSSGNLFGTAAGGGASNDGTVFELTAGSGAITTLASFNGSNGANPNSDLVEDGSGNLFGTTGGASETGTVFAVAAGSGTITTVASFNESSGYISGLVEDGRGNLFSTSSEGGNSGYGTVLEIQLGTLLVTNTADSGSGSLRQAILDANAIGVPSTIEFAASLDGQTITLNDSALPGIRQNVTITGPGASNLAISGNDQSGVFTIDAGAQASIDGLTIQDGNAGSDGGGAIENLGILTVSNCALTDNTAASGGAVSNSGTLTVSNCTLANNTASAVNGVAYGGGIVDLGVYGVLTVTNSTLANNVADYGGGIATANGATLMVTNSTLADNGADEAGRGIANLNLGGSVTLNNTLVADRNPLNDVEGELYSANFPIGFSGANDLIEDSSFLNSFRNSLQGNPLLAPLGDYGGSTQTMALLPGSPAIDAGNTALAVDGNDNPLTTDQRGGSFARFSNNSEDVDIGAFESEGFTIAETWGSFQSAALDSSFNQALTVIVSANNSAEPVDGGIVTFTAPGSGASATFSGTSTKWFFGFGRLISGRYRLQSSLTRCTWRISHAVAQTAAFAQWLSQVEIAAERLTAEQRGLLQAALAFRQRCGEDYYSSRLLSHFLLHCESGLKVAQIARLVGVSRPTASRQQGCTSKEAIQAAHHRLAGRAHGKLLPRYAGPIAEFVLTHADASRYDTLDFIQRTWGVRVSTVALHKFLKKYGLDRATRGRGHGWPAAAARSHSARRTAAGSKRPPGQPVPSPAPPFSSRRRTTPAPSC